MSDTTHYSEILSPCNNQCHNDVDNEYCTSCFRTFAEKKTWWKFTVEDKKVIIAELPQRAKTW